MCKKIPEHFQVKSPTIFWDEVKDIVNGDTKKMMQIQIGYKTDGTVVWREI